MTALQECIEALAKVEITPIQQRKDFLLYLQEEFEFTKWGRIDWELYPNKTIVETIKEIKLLFKGKGYKLDKEEIYIIWDEATLPVIKCTLNQVLKNIYDVIYVSFDTWIYSPAKHYVIEFHHDGTTVCFL